MQQQQAAAAGGGSVPTTEPPVTAALVDRLKMQLLQAYDNGDTVQATETIGKLEKCNLTKELLEMTRVGAVVNDIRKKVAACAPELSKRCRALIKCWQKLAEPRPTSSGSSSANGTPSYASPALRKGVTPGTPARSSRVTPVGSSHLTPGSSRVTPLGSSRLTPVSSTGSQSSGTSPAVTLNGLTATLQQKSGPDIPAINEKSRTMRKSFTVGADLARKAVEDSLLPAVEIVRNGKRKAESIGGSNAGITNGLGLSAPAPKRPHFNSAMASPATSHQSLLAARRANVKSTSELVAQLTENLPGYLSINLSRNQNSVEKKPENNNDVHKDAITGHTLATPVMFSIQPENAKKKEKRGRPSKKEKNKEKDERKSDKNVTEQNVEMMDNNRASTSAVVASEQVTVVGVAGDTSTKERVAPIRHGKYDWNAMLPTLETLRHREQLRAKPSNDPRKSYIINVLGREVLALPYIDVGVPDFLEYQFPEPAKFYAEENFMYGASRPS